MKSLIRHLGLAIGNVRHIRWFSWTLLLHIFLIILLSIFQQRENKEYDKEALEVTGELLAVNPDFSTLWNFRREILQHMKDALWVSW